MKKLLSILFILVLILVGLHKAEALTFEEGLSQSNKKPMIVIVYAQWADNYESYLDSFRALKGEFENNFNFVELDIASTDTKFFNSRYHIYPNLPYVLMYKEGGKVSRYIQRECVLNESCIVSRVKSFIQ